MLKIWSHIPEPATLHLSLDGELDAATSPELEQFIIEHARDGVMTLVFDLKTLTFVSSAGLRIFAKARKFMKSREGQVFFLNLSPQVKKVFEIVKAVPVSQVFQDVAELDAYLATIQGKES